MEYFNDFLSRVINLLSEFLFIFNRTLFKIGDSEVSIGTIVIFFASFYLLVIVSKNDNFDETQNLPNVNFT